MKVVLCIRVCVFEVEVDDVVEYWIVEGLVCWLSVFIWFKDWKVVD